MNCLPARQFPVGILALIFAASIAHAEVKPNGLFSENAVLQQKVKVPVWGTAKDGEKVTVEFQTQKVSTIATNGLWKLVLEPLTAGGPFPFKISGANTITLTNILVGEVWLCSGQSNMGWPLSKTENGDTAIAAATDLLLRLWFTSSKPADEPQRDIQGQWQESTTNSVASFSAVAYYCGKDLRKALNVPVGLIQSAVNGTPGEAWLSRNALASEPRMKGSLDRFAARVANYPTVVAEHQAALVKHKDAVDKEKQEGKEPPLEPRLAPDPKQYRDRLTGCYNGLIAPLQPYALKGVLWYQGEANIAFANEYRALLPLLIRTWREAWAMGDFPFLIVQIAPCGPPSADPTDSAWAELRESQRETSRTVAKTGIIVITDSGAEKDIHPPKKEPVGVRLALAARGIAYGERIVYSGPTYKAMKVEENKVVLSFDHIGSGLIAKEGDLKGFAIAGEDGKFVNAEARIVGEQIAVSSPKVAKPSAVRFGWANFPVVNFYNQEGLPASPFRTDDYPMTTAPKGTSKL